MIATRLTAANQTVPEIYHQLIDGYVLFDGTGNIPRPVLDGIEEQFDKQAVRDLARSRRTPTNRKLYYSS